MHRQLRPGTRDASQAADCALTRCLSCSHTALLWGVAGRTTQVATWLVLPFYQQYSEAGDFTVKARCGTRRTTQAGHGQGCEGPWASGLGSGVLSGRGWKGLRFLLQGRRAVCRKAVCAQGSAQDGALGSRAGDIASGGASILKRSVAAVCRASGSWQWPSPCCPCPAPLFIQADLHACASLRAAHSPLSCAAGAGPVCVRTGCCWALLRC